MTVLAAPAATRRPETRLAAGTFRARAPLRLGLAGGGTDLSPYCDSFGGCVLNAAIARYAYATLELHGGEEIRLVSHDLGEEEALPAADPIAEDRGLRLHRAACNWARETAGLGAGGFTLTTSIDCPVGAGLGASSALMVAMVKVLAHGVGRDPRPQALARTAHRLERQRLGLAGGRQDQYAAAFGGVNFMEFASGDEVVVNPLGLSEQMRSELEASMLLCFTGASRESARIIEDQVARIASDDPAHVEAMHQLKREALEMKVALISGRFARMDEILRRGWEAKKRTSASISNPAIEALQEAAEAAGARAAKISGAGGGGFMMLLVDPARRDLVRRRLEDLGSRVSDTVLAPSGAVSWEVA